MAPPLDQTAWINGVALTESSTAPHDPSAGVDNLLLVSGDNLLLVSDADDVLLLVE